MRWLSRRIAAIRRFAVWLNHLPAWEFIVEVNSRFGEDRVALAAGATAFFTMLSLAPLFLFVVSVAQRAFLFTPRHAVNLMARFIDDLKLSPVFSQVLHQQMLNVLFAKKEVLSDTILIFLSCWSGSQIFLILEAAMNMAWETGRKRPYWVRRGLALCMVLIFGGIMLVVAALTNLIRILVRFNINMFGADIRHIPYVLPFIISGLLPILLVTLLFTMIYRVLPAKRATLRTVFPGALFAGVLWVISLHAFGWYVARTMSFTIFYGSFWNVIVVMFWFYYSAFIMLLGAEIAATYHKRLITSANRQILLDEEEANLTHARREWEAYQERLYGK